MKNYMDLAPKEHTYAIFLKINFGIEYDKIENLIFFQINCSDSEFFFSNIILNLH